MIAIFMAGLPRQVMEGCKKMPVRLLFSPVIQRLPWLSSPPQFNVVAGDHQFRPVAVA
jgi:hypothetical protein